MADLQIKGNEAHQMNNEYFDHLVSYIPNHKPRSVSCDSIEMSMREVDGNHNHTENFGRLPRLLAAITAQPSVTEVSFHSADIGCEQLTAIAGALNDMHIKTLGLHENNLHELIEGAEVKESSAGIEALAKAIEGNKTLKTLEITGTPLSAEDQKMLVGALEKNTTITSVTLGSTIDSMSKTKLELFCARNKAIEGCREPAPSIKGPAFEMKRELEGLRGAKIVTSSKLSQSR